MNSSSKGKLVVRCFGVSADGFGAGPNQDVNNPMGVDGMALHQWVLPTRTFQKKLFGKDGGTEGPDDDFAKRGFVNIGAWILGRNMFGPVRGPWPDDRWKGWWGDEPPYHCGVFVLTHHARPPISMKGGTVFHFVTDGIEAALQRPKRLRATRISGWAAASPPSGNIFAPDSSMNCIWRFHRRCLGRAKICSQERIW